MSSYVTRKTPGDTSWFVADRFGMFIHWGLYALPARHEWIKNHECIPEEKYDLYFKHFDPDLYDPKEWARQAKAAGMKAVGVYDPFFAQTEAEMRQVCDRYIMSFEELL